MPPCSAHSKWHSSSTRFWYADETFTLGFALQMHRALFSGTVIRSHNPTRQRGTIIHNPMRQRGTITRKDAISYLAYDACRNNFRVGLTGACGTECRVTVARHSVPYAEIRKFFLHVSLRFWLLFRLWPKAGPGLFCDAMATVPPLRPGIVYCFFSLFHSQHFVIHPDIRLVHAFQ